jgi:hypothetical protein
MRPAAAPRLERRLVQLVNRLAVRPLPVAEVWRRVGAEAGRYGCTRPSYERVRQLTRQAQAAALNAAPKGAANEVLLLDFRRSSRSLLRRLIGWSDHAQVTLCHYSGPARGIECTHPFGPAPRAASGSVRAP